MNFKEPFKIYIAESNLEAYHIVELLEASGIAAFVEEDHAVTSLWALGRNSVLHQPNVWIDKSTTLAAAELIRQFEDRKQARANPAEGQFQIQVECEECGKISSFPSSQKGTTQDCPHCRAYMDVGELKWEDDFGTPEE